jgi:hypothetical protein
VYSVRISGDGEVVYEGRDYVDILGTQRRTIDPEDVLKLLREAFEIDFFEMAESYTHCSVLDWNAGGWVQPVGVHTTDLPSCTVGVEIAGQLNKQVYDYNGAPKRLRAFEAMIDEAAGTAEWIGEGSQQGDFPDIVFVSKDDK